MQVKHFNFGVSLFDLWLFTLLRVTVFAVLALTFCCNKEKILTRVKQLSLLCTLLLTILFCYGVAKLLASFEFYADGSPVHGHTNSTPSNSSSHDSVHGHTKQPFHPWLWGMLGWVVLTLLFYGATYFCIASIPSPLSKEKTERQKGKGSIQTSESTPLLNNVAMEGSVEAQRTETKQSGEKAKTEESSASTFKVSWRLILYCRPDFHLYLLGFIFLVASSAAMSFVPYYTGQVIDHIAIQPSMRKFEQAVWVMGIVTVVSAVCAGLRGCIFTIANARLVIRIRRLLFQSITRQEIAFFDVTETGDLTSRLTADTTKVSDQICLNLNIFLRNLVQCIGSVVFMVQLAWKLTAVTLVGIPLITIVTWYFGEYFKVR